MSLINQIGTFRGYATESAIGKSKNGFPQFVIQLHAVECYDEDLGDWVDWSEIPESEITAFLILFDGKGQKTLSCKQVQKIFNWDATSFEDLDNMDVTEVGVQFRVAESTYNDKTTLQVEWVDKYDASPGRIMRKLDPIELKELQAKYAKLLKADAPVKAPATAPKITATEAQKVIGKAIDEKKAPPKAPPSRTPPAPPASKKAGPKTTTKKEVWESCLDFKRGTVTDEEFSKVWTEEINKVAPTKTDDQITADEWGIIGDAILDRVGKF